MMSAPLKRPQPAGWWLQRGVYFQFMLRELSAVTTGIYVVLLLFFLDRFSRGDAAYYEFLAYLRKPWIVAFHFVALALALLHTITWFNATPRVIAPMRGEEKVPEWLLVLPNYLLWAAVTFVIFRAMTG